MKKLEFDLLDLIEKHMIEFGLLPEHGCNCNEDIDIKSTSDESTEKKMQN